MPILPKCKGILIKKINLLHETVVVSNRELLQALRSGKTFGITLKGEIRYAPFDPADIFIYQGQGAEAAQAVLSTPKPAVLGLNYKITEEGDRLLIRAANAWQDIIRYNLPYCHYDNTSAEGVTQFADEAIEDMGWMIIDFDVSYKELIEMLEEKADITLVCIEQEDPYHFSGMGYFNDIEATRKILFDFCQNTIKEKIAEDPDYALDFLDEDQREAAEFFNVI